MTESLSPNYRLRSARWEDAENVLKLIDYTCIVEGDPNGAGVSLDEFINEWKAPSFNPEADAWVVTAPSGEIVGYEELTNRSGFASLIGDGYVHPDHTGSGIGTSMLRALDERARVLMKQAAPNLRVYIRNGMSIQDQAARELHEHEGYQTVRYFWEMEIELDGPPPEPVWPAGIRIQPLRQDQDEHILYEVMEEAFADHWGHVPRSFETWSHRTFNSPGFDPSLYFLAWQDNQPAAGLMCKHRGEMAWVGTLGVRRPWRKRGLGLALMRHAFREFYQRGDTHIGLGVDASNPTGATRLYERAGMHVAREYVLYEKELRPGRELEEAE